MNSIILTGRLTADPEMRTTHSATAVTQSRLAVGRRRSRGRRPRCTSPALARLAAESPSAGTSDDPTTSRADRGGRHGLSVLGVESAATDSHRDRW